MFLVSEFKHHDRRIPLPGYTEYGIGSHLAFSTPNLQSHLGCKLGVCSTSNSFGHLPEEEKIMIDNDASVKEMEAAGIAWVCE